jgi:hypothetical protein
MLSLLFGLTFQVQKPPLITLPNGNRPAGNMILMRTPGLDKPRVELNASNVPLFPAKLSPKTFSGQPWEFAWHCDGFARVGLGDPSLAIRFRVFSQSHDEDALIKGTATDILATRELLRLWEVDANRLGIDHALDVHRRMVDVYLCDKGQPGGEQLFDKDQEAGQEVKVNTIYIYDLPSLQDPLEEAREVAHEYGHAVLPAVGGFNSPEYWANGYLGEKLFLRWLRDAMAAGQIDTADAMGATVSDLTRFVDSAVTPLEKEGSRREPSSPLFLGHSASAMGAFEGIVLWCDTVLPPKMFGRAMLLLNGNKPLDFVNSAALAAEEATYVPRFPAHATGPVWIPIGDSKVVGGEVLRKDSGWALVRPTPGLKVVAPASE